MQPPDAMTPDVQDGATPDVARQVGSAPNDVPMPRRSSLSPMRGEARGDARGEAVPTAPFPYRVPVPYRAGASPDTFMSAVSAHGGDGGDGGGDSGALVANGALSGGVSGGSSLFRRVAADDWTGAFGGPVSSDTRQCSFTLEHVAVLGQREGGAESGAGNVENTDNAESGGSAGSAGSAGALHTAQEGKGLADVRRARGSAPSARIFDGSEAVESRSVDGASVFQRDEQHCQAVLEPALVPAAVAAVVEGAHDVSSQATKVRGAPTKVPSLRKRLPDAGEGAAAPTQGGCPSVALRAAEVELVPKEDGGCPPLQALRLPTGGGVFAGSPSSAKKRALPEAQSNRDCPESKKIHRKKAPFVAFSHDPYYCFMSATLTTGAQKENGPDFEDLPPLPTADLSKPVRLQPGESLLCFMAKRELWQVLKGAMAQGFTTATILIVPLTTHRYSFAYSFAVSFAYQIIQKRSQTRLSNSKSAMTPFWHTA